MHEAYDESRLREHLAVLRRHKLLAVFVMILVTVAATTATASGGARYKALAEVLLSRQNVANQLTNLASPSSPGDFIRIADTQAGIASSPRVAQQALAFAPQVSGVTPNQLLENSVVEVKPNTDILRFIVEDSDRVRASVLANAYAKGYVEYRRNLDTTPIKQARRQAQARIGSLERNGDRSSALYTGLVAKDQQLSTAEALQGSNATVIRTAGEAGQTAPRIRRNAALGALVGVLLGIVAAFLTEAMNIRVRTPEEVKDALGLPLLGTIPPPSRALAHSLVMLEAPTSHSAEVFRLLRTNLTFANLEHNAKTILVTSAVPTEGKSTTVANLAVTLARTGSAVILVDLDLRRPSISGFFDIHPEIGITDVVLGASSLDDALLPVSFGTASDAEAQAFQARDTGSLRLLTRGWAPPDIGEFVGGKALPAILQQLRSEADFILIDSPPILSFGDALAVSESADALLVIARIGLLRRNVIRNLKDVLTAIPVRKLGVVATGCKETDHGYSYLYGYRYDTRETKLPRFKRDSPDRQEASTGS